jgi:hypothetical protein
MATNYDNECKKSKTRKPEMPDARHDGRPVAQPINRPPMSQSDSDFLPNTAIMDVDSSVMQGQRLSPDGQLCRPLLQPTLKGV